jgi:hypothetical protein
MTVNATWLCRPCVRLLVGDATIEENTGGMPRACVVCKVERPRAAMVHTADERVKLAIGGRYGRCGGLFVCLKSGCGKPVPHWAGDGCLLDDPLTIETSRCVPDGVSYLLYDPIGALPRGTKKSEG